MQAIEILRGFNEILNLGDLIYAVRDKEGEGWEGPQVTKWAKLHEEMQKLLAQIAGSTVYQRVAEEYRNLLYRFKKLEAFTLTDEFDNLDMKDRALMENQANYMHEYLLVLEERLERHEA